MQSLIIPRHLLKLFQEFSRVLSKGVHLLLKFSSGLFLPYSIAEGHSESSETSWTELLAKLVNGFQS